MHLRPTRVCTLIPAGRAGNVWSSSWKNLSKLSYGDFVLDANERICAFLNHHIVFPSNYMRAYHREWAHSGKLLVIPNVAHGMEKRLSKESAESAPVLGIGASTVCRSPLVSLRVRSLHSTASASLRGKCGGPKGD